VRGIAQQPALIRSADEFILPFDFTE